MARNVFAATTGFSSSSASNDWLGIGNKQSGTRALPVADPNNRLEYMKAIVQTANGEEEALPLEELIPFWFAVSSPLLGMVLGLLGAWFVAWVSL